MRNIGDLVSFLQENNAIEGVYDEDSLLQAKYAWEYLEALDIVDPQAILRLHKILMLHQPLLPNQKGYFREIPVYIGGREAMDHRQIRLNIAEWCKRANLMVMHPGSRIEKDIQNHHVVYEKIHPFVDGNGRTGRMLLNWQRVKAGLPILVIKESEKYAYYDWFN